MKKSILILIAVLAISTAFADEHIKIKLHQPPPNSIKIENNTLIYKLNEKDLDPAGIKELQGKNTYTIDKSFTLHPDVVNALGIKGTITIVPGTYPLIYANGTYTLRTAFRSNQPIVEKDLK